MCVWADVEGFVLKLHLRGTISKRYFPGSSKFRGSSLTLLCRMWMTAWTPERREYEQEKHMNERTRQTCDHTQNTHKTHTNWLTQLPNHTYEEPAKALDVWFISLFLLKPTNKLRYSSYIPQLQAAFDHQFLWHTNSGCDYYHYLLSEETHKCRDPLKCVTDSNVVLVPKPEPH